MHRYITGNRHPWEYKHALTICGGFTVCGIEKRQSPTDDQQYYYATMIWEGVDDNRTHADEITNWNLDGSNAIGNFEDLDMRTVLV